MKRVFVVTGYAPAHSKEANDFLKACDLGIDGAFVPFSDRVTATLRTDVTQEQLNRQPEAIKLAYEKAGCVQVGVVEVEDDIHVA